MSAAVPTRPPLPGSWPADVATEAVVQAALAWEESFGDREALAIDRLRAHRALAEAVRTYREATQ